MSFNDRVKVTNLINNSEVIVTVNGRIPAADSRIADISKEAGDAIGMSPNGLTRVRLEKLVPEQAAVVPAAAPVAAPSPAPAAPPPPANPPPARPAPTAPAPAPAPSSQEPVIENIQVISETPVQYIVAPAAPVQTCIYSPLCIVILVLLIIAVLLLTAILILILNLRRIPWWPGFAGYAPWYTPVWLRRYKQYLKKRRD
jgi:hypothetical protein